MNPFLESSAEPKERGCFVIDRVYRALVSASQRMIQVDDSLYLVETVGGGVEFCLEQSLAGRNHFQVVLGTVPHEQFRTPQSGLKGSTLTFIQLDALAGSLP